MLKVKKTVTHDRLSIKVQDGSSKVSLTWSRYRDTVSASMDVDKDLLRHVMELWTKILNAKKLNMGERLDLIEERAKTCTSIADFVSKLEEVLNSIK